MQDPNEDTEWNDILRKKGILPPKEKEIAEEDIQAMVDSTIKRYISSEGKKEKEMSDMTRDELDELEDDLDEDDQRELEKFRRMRIDEMRQAAARQRENAGVREISRADWLTEVNEASQNQHVLVHVYRQGLPICQLLDNCLRELNAKFPGDIKFLRSEVSVCMSARDFPDDKLPLLILYYNGAVKQQWMGAATLGGERVTAESLEWKLSQVGVLKTELEMDPLSENQRSGTNSIFGVTSKKRKDDSDDDNDW